jgi:hypothetical protein
MENEISKAELLAVIEVMSKNATQLENIANSFRTTCEELKEINQRLNNGIVDDIKEAVTGKVNNIVDEVKEVKDIVSNNYSNILTLIDPEKGFPVVKSSVLATKEDIGKAKWFIGIIGFAIIVSTVILRGIDNRKSFNEELKQTITTMQKTNSENMEKIVKQLNEQR